MTQNTPAVNPSFVRRPTDFGNAPQPPRNERRRPHLIARVEWPTGIKPEAYGGCAIECECGWAGTVGEWPEHRGAK